jgi:hypothetical protein
MRTCPQCGSEFEPKPYQIKFRSYYCPACRSRATVISDRANIQRKLRTNSFYLWSYYQRYPEKKKAKALVRSAIRAGKIKRQPCEKCGVVPTHAHHDDYMQPLNVRWLCVQHHADHHRLLKAREQ